jgi:GWxTD domain-containing protein
MAIFITGCNRWIILKTNFNNQAGGRNNSLPLFGYLEIKVNKKNLIMGLAVVLLYMPASSQSIVNDTICFNFDYACFSAAEGWSYLELYFSIPRSSLSHSGEHEKLQAVFEIIINLYKEDSLIHNKTKRLTDVVDSLNEVKKGEHIIDLYALFLLPGQYRCKVNVKDLHSGIEGDREYDIDIRSFTGEGIKLSDIQLGYRIMPRKQQGRFIKNGYYVLPNPSGIYGPTWPNLYYYTEIYNLSDLQEGSDSCYTVTTIIKDNAGTVVKEMPAKRRIRKGMSVVEVGHMYVGTLISDSYHLQIIIRDNGNNDSISMTKPFFVYRAADYAGAHTDLANKQAEMNAFHTLSEKELDRYFDMMRYIASGYEKKVYHALNTEGKRQFLLAFWKKLDTVPETEVNEFKNEYLQRVGIANERYGAGAKEGWRTDQGRIFIIYGKPDQIDRYHGGFNQYPYQIWHYYGVEGGVEFVFVDTAGYGVMRLVHSTAKNEIRDYEWQTRWKK